jgi:hypothetical protein
MSQRANIAAETIQNKIREGKTPTSIIIESYDEHGYLVQIQLSEQIWEGTLVESAGKAVLLPIWQAHLSAIQSRNQAILSLVRSDPKFVQNSRNILRDLQNFNNDAKARARLEGTGHVYFLDPPYFNEE